jgi:hypothetical protein
MEQEEKGEENRREGRRERREEEGEKGKKKYLVLVNELVDSSEELFRGLLCWVLSKPVGKCFELIIKINNK